MKKVININFQGRVIPIEESSYDLLKQYIDSLRRYFADEDGRDEIINDIEGRIAELFEERLKNGSVCITDADVEAVIAGMGKPEDFDPKDTDTRSGAYADAGASAQTGSTSWTTGNVPGRGSLYRNADDKILGGVCSGLANYFRIDPVIMRIIFVVFIGFLLWVYILLWIIVPSKSIQSSVTKRLYRNPDQKVIGGVAGGLAAYFNIDVWIPRSILVLPFVLAIFAGGFHPFWWHWDFGFVPNIISGSFGWSMFLIYVILWIAVPMASTSAEKLEMRGEKIDLDSIRHTVNKDLRQFRSRTEKMGSEVKESAENFRRQATDQARAFSAQAGPAVRRTSNGLGHALGVIIKAFFLFIFAIVAISLFGALIGILFGGFAFAPLKNFILQGSFQNGLTWTTLFLFFGIPFVALVTWGIRRIMGVRSSRHYLGFAFGGLWFAGIICAIILFLQVTGNYREYKGLEEEPISISQPESTLHVTTERYNWKMYNRRWFKGDHDWGTFGGNWDSIKLNTVKVSMVKSNDSAYHVYRVRSSRGRTENEAEKAATAIAYEPSQTDTTLFLPNGFYINKQTGFRNQRVWIVVEIPVGKKVSFGRNISTFDWFTINYDRHNFNIDGDDDDDHDPDYADDDDDGDDMYRPHGGYTYIMRDDGHPERISD
jgi:phage shock protein PspC (stress-responsive transcriptional regulator)